MHRSKIAMCTCQAIIEIENLQKKREERVVFSKNNAMRKGAAATVIQRAWRQRNSKLDVVLAELGGEIELEAANTPQTCAWLE